MKINVQLDLAIEDISNIDGYSFDALWVGFKNAMEAVEKYEILSNCITIYTQNFGPEESFITTCGANEVAKRSDIYSKVRHKYDLAHCGDFLTLTTGNIEFKEVEIPIKIDLHRFLPLSNIQYLTAFAGKLELKIMFGTQELVYCPVGRSKEFISNIHDYMQFELDKIASEFTQIVYLVTMWTNTPITYEIEYDIADDNYYAANKSTPPLMALLQDTVISIHVHPNGMPTVIEISQYDFTSR